MENTHEYQIQKCVSQLIKHVKMPKMDGTNNSINPTMLVDLLNSNRTPLVTTQVFTSSVKQAISKSCSNFPKFLKLYEELESRRIQDLDALCLMISQISQDSRLKKNLEQSYLQRAEKENFDIGTVKFESVQNNSKPPSAFLRKCQENMMSHDFVDYPLPTVERLENITDCAVINDLLSCLQGDPGQLIQPRPMEANVIQREFCIDSRINASQREIISRVIPLCSHYSLVSRFICERSCYEYGLVNQSLAAAMQSILNDYLIVIAQLEHQFHMQELTLAKISFYLQPSLGSMQLLDAIATAIIKTNAKGGEVLSIMHEKTMPQLGNQSEQEQCMFLTNAACTPYFKMLQKWIFRGISADQYGEFFIDKSNEVVAESFGNDIWKKMYRIIPSRIPIFLQQQALLILNTGKYLNVVDQCGIPLKEGTYKLLKYSIYNQELTAEIDKAHENASQLLMDYLMKEKHLLQILRSVKRFFLLDHGDFITEFMDIAHKELQCEVKDVSLPRLENLLQIAIRSSTTNDDPYKDFVLMHLYPQNLSTHLFKVFGNKSDSKVESPTVLEVMSLKYQVDWPISLVLNPREITLYQLLFRHLFYCRHVERTLFNAWIDCKLISQSVNILRQHMLCFVQNLLYYMFNEVIENHWLKFEERIAEAKDIDQVLSLHTDLLSCCLNDCMLSNEQLFKGLVKLLAVCVNFANNIKHWKASAVEKPDTNFENMVSASQKDFSSCLKNLLGGIANLSTSAEEHRLACIINRIGFSTDYYS